jgi:hypothetical protein
MYLHRGEMALIDRKSVTDYCTVKMQGLNFILCGCCRLKKTMLEVDLGQERRIFMCIKLQITSQRGTIQLELQF